MSGAAGGEDARDETRRGCGSGASRTRARGETWSGQPGRGGGVGSNDGNTDPATTSTTPSAPTTGPR